ncbi:MAG: protein-L-isoaspartate(D-aspartate) O-methyltransferase [Bacillota bacterium]|nr:protein-L-isoaspartate(D-aspartate) O-methyltransferase [Bacillota bacterium]
MFLEKEKLIEFYKKLDRSYFMEKYKEYAKEDAPFPIGYGQTISQPSLVLKMSLLLEIHKKCKVLEIGTGSGYQTALLAKFAKEVFTVERIEPLHKRAKERLEKAGYNNINYKLDDGSIGWEEHSPYNRIIVTAAATEVPEELIAQLANGGRMIIPVGPRYLQDLMLIRKDEEGKVTEELIEKVKFVPLIGKYE